MSEFDRVILDYIRKKLREGIRDAAIIEELTDSTDPLFVSICGDVGIAADYLAHARSIITARDAQWGDGSDFDLEGEWQERFQLTQGKHLNSEL